VPDAERTRLAAGVCARLIRLAAVVQARHVGAYAAIGSEIDPAPAVAVAGSLGAVTYYPGGEAGALQLLAASGELDPSVGAVVLVPGVGFTPDGRRLGRGAGEYDRLLTRYPAALRVGIACELQLVSELPEEPWDQRMHLVVTEARLFVGVARPAHPSKETHP
jgi:5-formyltetrahydrofolate cyclo-ligase